MHYGKYQVHGGSYKLDIMWTAHFVIRGYTFDSNEEVYSRESPLPHISSQALCFEKQYTNISNSLPL